MAKDTNGNKHVVITNDKGKSVVVEFIVKDGRVVADTDSVQGVKQ